MLEFKTPVWLDDIICVTNGTIEQHEDELREILSKLQDAGYRVSEKKTEIFKRELVWWGYHKNQNGEKRLRLRQNRSDHNLTSTRKRKRIEIVSGINSTSIQIHKQPFQEDRQNEISI